MIQNYLYSMPKRKKVFYGILITMVFISLISIRTQSGFFSWAAGKVTDNITDEIFNALNESLGEAIGGIADWFINIITGPFGPDMSTFETYTVFGTMNGTDFIKGFSISVGMFIATLIWGFSMFVYFFSGKITDSKDTPISLTGKYILAIAIAYKQTDIIETFLDLINILYTSFTKKAIGITAGAADGALGLSSYMFDKAGKKAIYLFAEPLVFELFPIVSTVIIILQIVLIWKMCKAFIQLYVEMISRYIVSIVLLLLFSAFAGTMVSNNTSQIFKSYLRTLFSSFVVMLFNIVWMKLCIIAAFGGTTKLFTSLLTYIFVLELLHFGTKFDGMLRSMGLGVATGGSRIASALGGAGRNLANSLRNANATRQRAGGLMKAAGLASGNKGLYNAGQKLGTGLGDIATGKNNDRNSAFNMAVEKGKLGGIMPDSQVSKKEAANIMGRALGNPNDREAQSAMAALSPNKLREGAQEMLGNGYKVNSAQLQQQRGDDGRTHRTIGFEAQKEGVNGNKPFKGQIGGDGTFKSGLSDTNANGQDGIRVACGNSLGKGEKCDIKDAAYMAGQSAADALDGVKIKGQSLADMDNAKLEYCGKDANGQDSFRVRDDDSKAVLGSINGDKFTASTANFEPETRNGYISKAQDAVTDYLGGGRNEKGELNNPSIRTTGFVPDADNPGRYKAVYAGEDDTGSYKMTATLSDKGQLPTSSLDFKNANNFECPLGEDADHNPMSLDVSFGEKRYSKDTSSPTDESGEKATFEGGKPLRGGDDIPTNFSAGESEPIGRDYTPSEESSGLGGDDTPTADFAPDPTYGGSGEDAYGSSYTEPSQPFGSENDGYYEESKGFTTTESYGGEEYTSSHKESIFGERTDDYYENDNYRNEDENRDSIEYDETERVAGREDIYGSNKGRIKQEPEDDSFNDDEE